VGRRTSDPDWTDRWHRPNRPGIGQNLSGTRPIVDSELLDPKAERHPPYPGLDLPRSPATSCGRVARQTLSRNAGDPAGLRRVSGDDGRGATSPGARSDCHGAGAPCMSSTDDRSTFDRPPFERWPMWPSPLERYSPHECCNRAVAARLLRPMCRPTASRNWRRQASRHPLAGRTGYPPPRGSSCRRCSRSPARPHAP
jgi:hypothetical protein